MLFGKVISLQGSYPEEITGHMCVGMCVQSFVGVKLGKKK